MADELQQPAPAPEDAAAQAAPDSEVPAAAPAPAAADEPAQECPPCKGGAPGWMATFADMATLLMAFFVLLLSFSDVELPKFEQINGSIKQAFGVKRLIPTINMPMARSLIVENFSPALAQRTVIPRNNQQPLDPSAEFLIRRTRDEPQPFPVEDELRTVRAALAEQIERGDVSVKLEDEAIVVEFSAELSAGGPGGSGRGSASAGAVNQELVEVAAIVARVQSEVVREVQLQVPAATDSSTRQESAQGTRNSSGSGRSGSSELYNDISASLRSDIQQGLVEVEKVGSAVVIRLAEQGSFVSGSADLAPGFLPLLARVGQTLTQGNGRVRVEGHTDAIPVGFSERFNSNWDLSAARSASVANYFSTQAGVAAARLEVSGFADTKPLDSNATAAGRARNRRIEIIVEGN